MYFVFIVKPYELKPWKIRSMNEPPSEIKDIMKAVFVLLGEAPSKLETWTGIRALIGKTGPDSLRRRICEFNPKSLINQEVTVKHAKSLCKNQSKGSQYPQDSDNCRRIL